MEMVIFSFAVEFDLSQNAQEFTAKIPKESIL